MRINLVLLAVVFQIADCVSTRYVLAAGGSELNPLFGCSPDPLMVFVAKTVVLMLLLQQWADGRRLVLFGFIMMGVLATMFNITGLMLTA